MATISRREFTASVVGSVTVGATALATAAPLTLAQARPAASAPDALSSLTLAEASARIRSGAVTSTDLVKACLARIDVYNPKVNAFITVMRDAALAQAKVLDAEQQAGKLRGPLHGIPIALKDNIDTAGHENDGCERRLRRARAGRRRRGRATARCRGRDLRRQGEPARVRLRRHVGDELLRAGAKSLGARPQSRRVVGRVCRRRFHRSVLRRARYGYRRIDSDAGVVLQRRGAEADLRPCVDPRHHPADVVTRSLRTHHAHRWLTPR